MLPRPPRSPLFPYTTLFRSLAAIKARDLAGIGVGKEVGVADHRGFIRVRDGHFDHVDAEAGRVGRFRIADTAGLLIGRSEEHTSELQSLTNLVCRLLLEKKK